MLVTSSFRKSYNFYRFYNVPASRVPVVYYFEYKLIRNKPQFLHYLYGFFQLPLQLLTIFIQYIFGANKPMSLNKRLKN